MKILRSCTPSVAQFGFTSSLAAFYVTTSITGFTVSMGLGWFNRHMNYLSLRVNWGQFDRGVRLSRYSC